MKKQCEAITCTNLSHARGYCHKHYWRLRNRNNVYHEKTFVKKLCGVERCNRVHLAKNMCELHYDRFRKHGNVLEHQRPNERHGMSKSREYKIWSLMKIRCTSNDKQYSGYKERLTKVCDRWLNSFQNFYDDMGKAPSLAYTLDRIDNNGNYEPGNCRWATRSQQSINKGLYGNNTSGYRGVYRVGNKWSTCITLDKKTRWLGTYDDKETAAEAYNKAALELHGYDAKLNVIVKT